MHSGLSHPELRGLVIVPAFNERQSVGKLAHRLKRALPHFDVLVIDDGSTDDTLRQIPAHAAVVSLPFNLGIGGAMQTGYRYAALNGYDVAIQVDGDGQHRPGEVQRLVDYLIESGSDMVVGSRFLGEGRYKQSISRLVGIGILSSLIRLLSGLPVTDCTSGFRVINRRVIQAFAHWYPDDYPEPEVILLLHRSGFKITELGVKMRQRRAGMTSIPLMRGLFYVLKVTTALLLDMARDPWPMGKVSGTAQAQKASSNDVPSTGFDSQPDPGPVWRNAAVAGGTPTQAVQAQGALHAAVPDAGPALPGAGGLAAGR
jgi:glycosyltransferase involved in cell wall biosynthesis